MTLIVRDGNNNSVNMKTTDQSGEETPHHFVDGTVSVINDGSNSLLVSQSHLYTDPLSMVNAVSTISSTLDAEILSAPGASLRYYITSLSISNASSSDVRADIKNGNIIFFSVYVAAQGGGAVMQFPVPIRCDLNTAVNGVLSASVNGCIITLQGYTSA
jgi:hypothetical protein